MIRSRIQTVFLCLLLALPVFTSAQEQKDLAPEKDQALKQALEMLEAIATSIPSLRSADNRIYLSTTVADLMWSYDEKRSRALFETLQKEVSSVIASLNPGEQRSINLLSQIQQQRREIIDRMAQRDPEMARSFMRATRPPSSMMPRGNHYWSETNLELHLAGLIAQKNPQQALKIARAGIRKGVTYSVVSVLHNLFSKDPEAARTLHSEIIDRLKTSDLASDYESSNAAWNLLGSFQPPQATDDTYRSLVELLATSVLNVRPDARNGNSIVQNASGQISSYITVFEKYTPGKVGALKQWNQQLARTQDPGSALSRELSELSQKGSVEDLLELVGKNLKEHHSQIYQHAAQKAVNNGDGTRALQIIAEFIPEGSERVQMLEQIHQQLFWACLNANKIAEAIQVLERIQGVEQKFHLLLALANNVQSRGEKKQAASFLSEANALLDTFPRNSQRLTFQLQLAQAYASLDPQQTVALLQPVIVLVNQLVEAAAVLDGFENSYLSQGEWMKRNHTNLGNVVNSIGQNLGLLARVDADGARSLSNQLERPEIRLMAQLEIAQNLLNTGRVSHSNFRRLNSIITVYPRNFK